MVKVKALQRVYYAGKEYVPGDEFDATDTHALQLGVIRKVMKAETRAETAAPQQSDDSPPKGRHKRRDMKAED